MPFNLVDLIKDQVTDTVLEKASGLLGGDGAKVAAGVEGAVPALLGGLAGAASTPERAGVLLDTIKRTDDSVLTNFAGALGGSHSGKMLDQGSSVLTGLMGSGMVDKLGSALSSATGMSSGGSGSLMSMLVPPILGVLKKKVVGDGLDVGGLTSMLNGQKANIANAMPANLASQLGGIDGFPSLAGLADGVKDAAGNVTSAASGAVGSATAGLGAVAGGVTAAAAGAAGKFDDVGQSGVGAVSSATNKVGDTVQYGVDAAGDAAQGGVNAVSGAAGKVGDAARHGVDTAGDVAQGGVNAVSGAAGKIGDAARHGVDAAGDVAQGGINAVSGAAGKVGDAARHGVDAAGDMAQGGVNAVSGAAGKVGDAARHGVDAAGDMAQGGVNAVSGAAGKVGDAAQHGVDSASSAGGGLFKWLIPLLVVLGLGWLAYTFLGEKDVDVNDAASGAATAVQSAAVGDVNVGELSGNVTGMFSKATETLSGITDADSATAALPGLEELSGQVSGLPAMFDKVPEAARGPLQGAVSSGLGSLQPMVDKVMAIPGVGSILEPVLKPMMETLGGLTG